MIWVLSVFLAVDAQQFRGADQTLAQSAELAGYVLGPYDQITVSVVEFPEFGARLVRKERGDSSIRQARRREILCRAGA